MANFNRIYVDIWCVYNLIMQENRLLHTMKKCQSTMTKFHLNQLQIENLQLCLSASPLFSSHFTNVKVNNFNNQRLISDPKRKILASNRLQSTSRRARECISVIVKFYTQFFYQQISRNISLIDSDKWPWLRHQTIPVIVVFVVGWKVTLHVLFYFSFSLSLKCNITVR